MEEALAQLQPSQKKLVDTNSERIVNVIDSLVKRVELLPLTTHLDKISFDSNLIDEDAREILDHHRSLIRSIRKQPTLTAQNDLKTSTRHVMRLLRTDANVLLLLQSAYQPSSAGSDHLLDRLAQLRALVRQKLLTTVEEQRSHKQLLQKLVSREASHQKEVCCLVPSSCSRGSPSQYCILNSHKACSSSFVMLTITPASRFRPWRKSLL